MKVNIFYSKYNHQQQKQEENKEKKRELYHP